MYLAVQREAYNAVEKTGQNGDHRFHLYVRPTDAKAAQWEGARSGTQAALDVFNADEVCRWQTSNNSKAHLSLVWRCEQVREDSPFYRRRGCGDLHGHTNQRPYDNSVQSILFRRFNETR